MRARTVIVVFAAILVGLYYHWGVRAAGDEFRWGQNIDGYYNLLARGFVGGHLYLPAEVSPELLAKPDPYDASIDDSLKLFDAALFNKHYYLYHGAGPAILLFLPWRLITGHDVPENYAAFLFCYFGFLFSGGALMALLRLAGREPGPVATGVLLLGLGFCQSVPFLLNRTWVYEIAIAGGYFCVSAALYFLLRGGRSWIVASGLACGFAIACRPHLGLFAVAFGLLILLRDRRNLIAFTIPIAIAGIAIGVYNYERFGNPAEFGIRYLLTGHNQNRIKLDAHNILPASYYLLVAAPHTGRVFPWVQLPWPPEDIPRPKGFFLEPSVGAIWLAPFLPAIFLLPMLGRARLPALLIAAAATGVFLFLACTGWSTQRYEVDFLPMLVLVSLAAAALPNLFATALLTPLVVAGSLVSLAIAVGGPVDEMMQRRPDRLVRLSQLLTPVDTHRLRLNPPFSFRCPIAEGPAGQMILKLGASIYRYELLYDGSNLVSRRFGSAEARVPVKNLREAHVRFEPASLEVVVSESGAERLRHRVGALAIAPVEIHTACGGRALH